MPRKILALACVVVGLHIIEALTLGTSTLGSFLANWLQIFACGLAVAMAFGACRRGRGLSRPFWLILGAGVALWGVANLGWMYYEVVLHSEPPSTSVVRFLFGLENLLLAMVLCQDMDKDSQRIDEDSALAVSGWRNVGGAVATEIGRRNWFTNPAKDRRRLNADQCHICAGAVDHSLASRATGSRVAAPSLLPSRSFDLVLCRAAEHQPVSRDKKRQRRADAHPSHGFGNQWHGHPGCGGKIHVCESGIRANDRQRQSGSSAGKIMA